MTTKHCPSCNQTLEVSNFSKNVSKKDGLSSQCKECKKKYQNSWYVSNRQTHIQNAQVNRKNSRKKAREFVINYLAKSKCADCPETNPIVLQFDHIKGSKKYDISYMVTMGYGVDSIKEEISKCEVRCANCHTLRTYSQRKYRSKTHP